MIKKWFLTWNYKFKLFYQTFFLSNSQFDFHNSLSINYSCYNQLDYRKQSDHENDCFRCQDVRVKKNWYIDSDMLTIKDDYD